MAIIHLISNLNPNGNTSQLLALLKAGRIAEECHIFTFSPILSEFRTELNGVLTQGNVQIHEFRTHFPTEMFWLLQRRIRQLRLRPTVIHVWDDAMLRTGFYLAQLFHARAVATLRHWSPKIRFERGILSRYDCLATNSRQLLRKMKENGLQGNWNVIHDALSSENTENTKTFPTRETLLTELGLPLDSVLAMCVGPITQWKRWQWAVWTIDSIVRVHPEMHLLFLDPDLENARLRHLFTAQEQERRAVGAFVKQYEREAIVHFLPYRKDWSKILSPTDYFWNMQTQPGGGLSILEAAVMGTPIISSRAGAVEDIFPENSITFLSNSPETTELAGKTHCLWIDPSRRAEQVAVAQEIARRYMNYDGFGIEYYKLYQ